MTEDLDALVDGVAGQVPRIIAGDPYILEPSLKKAVDADEGVVEDALATLEEAVAIVSLTRGGDSKLESRVSQQAFVLNPERDAELRDRLDEGDG